VSLTDAELVIFSPLPPRRSGIAAYTAELVAYLGRHRRTVVVVESQRDVVETPGALVISQARYLSAGWLRRLPHLYQLGNNPDHAFVYRACQRVPGVVVLHDPVLHHLIEELTLGRRDPQAYEAVLMQCHGSAGRWVAQLRRLGLFSDRQRFLLPLHRHVVDASRGVLVHSYWAAARVQASRAVPVRAMSHHISPRVADFDGLGQVEARRRLDLPLDLPVLLSLGYVTPPKQVGLVLRALARLHAAGFAFRYVIGGDISESLGIPELVRTLGLAGVVRMTGWLSEDAFFTYARAADLLANLRFPLAGETSGTLARALGMGLPALVFDVGPMAEWPDEAVYKLRFNADPLPELTAMLGRLLADRVGLATQGRRARRIARAEAAPERSVEACLAAIRDWC
jgi:glycosyltransferase involved in cell wall biosynthesis